MFRRARLNVRPNVRPAGRGAGSAADPKPQSSDSPVAATTESAAGEATEPPPVAPEVDSDNKADGANDAGEASKPAEVPMQRRKRISTMPNLVKPRAAPSSAHQPASKPQRRASQAPEGSALLQKEPSPSEKSHAESPVKPPMLPEKKTPVPQVPQFSPLKKSVSKEQTVCVAAQKNDDCLQKNVASPLKERPTQERSGAQEEKLPTKPPVKEKRTCSDRERILKARKLREMLKEELKKERMLKHRPPIIEGRSPPDHSKMTMRDLIYYLPENNPMKSSLAEEKRTERNSALSQMKEQEEKSSPDCDDDNEKEEGENEESQDGPLLVPRVKVAEDGSIILDEESLTVEVLRTKGPRVVEENDPIFERGSTTTYSSFRKSFYTKPWSNKETDMFFLAISMVGTDFSLIGRLFPHRARAEIKNKFKREEKANGWRIDKAFKEKRPFDFEFFAQLLEKVLADEEKRKQKTVKSQKPKEKKPSRPRKKPKVAKNTNTEAANEQGDLQEARISDAEADAVMAEKENEESLGISEEAEQTALEPALTKKKKKRKRKDEEEVENLLEETSVPSKAAEVKSSKKIAEKKVPCDASNDGHTAGGEEMNSVMEGNQGETAVTREERSESCLPADHRMETENSVNLCSFEDGSDVMLETNSAELRTQDVSCTLQESEISELTVVETRGKERQSEETSETKKKEGEESPRQEESQSASESDSQSEIMKNRKRGRRGKVQAPQSSSERSVRRRNAAPQKKMNALAPVPVNADEKCLAEDSRRNKDEATAGETMDLESKSQESEEAVAAKAVGRGRRQRFKPHVTRASVSREKPGEGAGEDEVPHPWPKRRTRKYTGPSKSSGPISEGATGKDDKGLETISESNEAAGLQEGSKQSVLKPAPLKRGRGKRSTPNLPQTVARQKGKKGKTAGVQVVEALVHRWDDKSDPFPITDVMAHEDAQPCSMMLEEGVPSDSKMDTKLTQQSPQEKSAESKDYESEKESSDVLEKVSELETGDKLSFGEESKERDTQPMHQEKKPNLESRPNLMGVTGREDDPKEGENRGEDTAENTDAAKCLMLEEPGVSSQSSTERVEAASFSKATRKRNFTEPVKTPFKRCRQNTVQSSEISSESDSDEEEYYSCQQRVKVQQWKHLRRPTKGNVLPKLFLERVPGTSSECETDSSEEENQTQDSTPCSSRGNKLSIAYRKKFRSKLFQASQEKEEEEKKEKEKGDTEPNGSEYFTLEEANKVPAFLPKGLPKPVPVQTDETMEEMSGPGVQVAADAETPKPEIQKERKESTSAAETTAHEDPEVDKGTSSKELLPSGYESMINAENQSTGTGTDVKEYFEENAVGTRRGGEMQGRNSGELTAEATSLKPEGSCLGAEDSQNKSSVAEISEQSPCRAEASVSNINSQQVGAHAQQRSVSSMEATSVGKDDHKCLEEEQSFILTLVGISNYSKGLDASPLLEDIPEEYLPAPIIIKPIKTRESVATEVKSSGSLATDDDEFAEPSRSYAEAKLESTPSEAFLDLQAIQKRSSSYEDIDSPPAKRTLSGAGAEGNLDTIYKGYSSKSDDSPDETCASPFQDTDDLSKENLLSSLLLFDSTALLPGKKHDETSETLKTASRENEASKQEKEVMMSGLTSKSKEEISGQGKQEHVHEFALLEPTVSLPSESQLLSTDQKSLEFLPSTCKKSSSESTEDIKGKTEKTQSSQIVTPKESPKDPTQSTEDKESCSISSTMASLSMEDEKVGAETADMVPTNKPQEMPPFCDEEKEEEAIKISEYFFSDIFMEVEDSD